MIEETTMARTASKTDPVADAVAQLQQLEADHGSWSIEHEAATGELAELADDRGRRLVDGDASAEDLVAEEARHRSRISNADAALVELGRRIAEGRRRVIAAHIEVLEERLAPHQRALAEHRTNVEDLLRQLERLDGVPYVVMSAHGRAEIKHGGPLIDAASAGSLPASKTTCLAIPVNDLQGRISKLREWANRPLGPDEYTLALTHAERAVAEEPATTTRKVAA